MPSKEQIEKAAEMLSGSLYPNETADEIIAEVMAHGKASKMKVINILLEYLAKSQKNKIDFANDLRKSSEHK